MIGYEVDFSDVKVFLNRMRWEGDAATAIFFSKYAHSALRQIIIDTIQDVAPSAGPGFPELYTQHLIEVVSLKPPIRNIGGGLEVDFTMLGTYEDLARGFHRHAISDNNERIMLPYAGQELKNVRKIRQVFWEDKVADTWLYDDTIYDRINTWGMLAPEWWILNNGSPTYPRSNPTALSELVSARAIIQLAPIYEQALQDAVNRADQGWATTPTGGLRHNIRGGDKAHPTRFSPRGR